MDAERLERLDAMIRENRIIRCAWTERDRACLLAALSPEAGQAQSASACPAEIMPEWLAYLTPWLDDAPSEEAWPALVRRYAALARRWHALDADGWERARIGVLIAIVTEARSYCPSNEAVTLTAIDEVLAWLRRGAPEAGREAAARSAAAAETAAADRIAASVLNAIEREIVAAEGGAMIGRDCRCPGCGTCDAASEVERLRAEVERLRALLAGYSTGEE